MNTSSRPALPFGLIIGDILAIAVLTGFGFAFHGGIASAGSRMLTTFLPLLVGWFVAAPAVGAYRPDTLDQPRQLWRPVWAMLLAGPMAAWLRGVMLGNAPIQPVFVLVLTGVAVLGMAAWRALYLLLARRSTRLKG